MSPAIECPRGYRSSRNRTTSTLKAAACVAVLTILSVNDAVAMIPWYVEDYRWDTGNQPAAMRVIGEHAQVYCENAAANDGDAVHFDAPGGPELIRYVGFRNIHFSGVHGGIDPDRTVHSTESNFYHTVDPATLTAWRRADGIELHWTPDARFVFGDSLRSLPDATDVVSRHRIDRYVLGQGEPDLQQEVQGADSWVDSGADPATSYRYALLSWDENKGQYVGYSEAPCIVEATIEDRPHFWGHKDDYQEKFYLEMATPTAPAIAVDLPIRFSADRTVNPAYAILEVYRGANEPPLEIAGFAYDNTTHILSIIVPTSTTDFLAHGGLAYRLVYSDPGLGGGSIIFPAADASGDRYMNTTINNRLMQVDFFAYEARIDSWDGSQPTYWSAFLGLMEHLRAGHDFGQGMTTFDGVLMDCVGGGFPPAQNRPFEFTNTQEFRDSNAEAIEYLCANNPGFSHYANTNDLELIEALAGTVGFAGTMDEKWPNWGGDNGSSWEQHCLEALWKSRANPGMVMILEDARDYEYNLADREQQLGAYLFVRHPDASVAAEKSLLGYGAWRRDYSVHADPIPYPDDVVILPEQMLNFGDAVSDPFDIDWPDASEILSARTSVDSAIDWFENETPGLIRETTTGARPFAVREYYVDGGDGTQYIAYAVADFSGASSSPTMVSLQEIFPDKAASTFYRLRLQGASPLITKGARLWTDAVGFEDSWPSAAGVVAVFFTQPVRSPEVIPTAVDTISGNPKYISTLRVLANHWNRKPLYIEVDCTELNGNSAVHLYCASHDSSTGVGSYRATITNVLAGDGTLSLPFRATGTDGLMLFGNIDVIVDSGHTQTFKDYSDSSMVSVLESAITSKPLSIMPVNADGGAVMDLLISEEGATGKYFNAEDNDRFVPNFFNDTVDRFVSQSDHVRAGASSCAAADYDTMGHEGFFACSEDGFRLYRLSEVAGNKYVDDTAASISDLPDTAFAAAWYDYTRDGFVDLAIAGTDGTGDGIYFYRNRQGVLEFVEKESLDLGQSVRDFSAPYPMLWADLDLDDGGEVELIVGAEVAGVPTMRAYARAATFNTPLLRYEIGDASDDVFPDGAPTYVTRAVLADVDGDGDQDLVVARAGVGAAGDMLMVYRNTAGQLRPVTVVPGATFADSLASVLVADMDPDGKPDIIAVPAGQTAPRLLLNSSSTDIAFVEESTTLAVGAATGGLAYDWLGGKPNLYLAKAPVGGAVENFFYGYEPAPGVSLGKTVRVRVGETDVMNSSGIGTRIEVEWDGKHAYQWFNGGGGRGEQQPRELVFSLGHVTGMVIYVRALWPDGIVTELYAHKQAADLFLVERSSPAVIYEESVSAGFLIDPGGHHWYRFEWDADRQAIPEVTFWFADAQPECRCGVADSVLTLTPETPGVGLSFGQTGEDSFHYEMIWGDRCCPGIRCTFRYRVRCRLNGVVTESETNEFMSPRYCPSN